VIATQDLLRLKKRALRLNIWFKVLSKTERAIIDLTLRCVERIRSPILEATVCSIADKVLRVLGCGFLLKAGKIGHEMAIQVSQIAQEWGNQGASEWILDSGFVRFLGVITLNQ
jgi:hypothetical protein